MVLVVGDISIDISAPLAADPVVGEDCLSPTLSLQCGGVGLNIAIALSRLGVPARLVGCVGEDLLADFVLRNARALGVNTEFIQRTASAMTGLFLAAISPDGQRTFFGSRGANAELRWDPGLHSALEQATAVQVAGFAFLAESSARCATELISAARSRGTWTALDVGMGPSRRVPARLLQVMREVDALFINSSEAEALTGFSDPQQAFTGLEEQGAREVIFKLGGNGCLIRDQAGLRHVPPFPVHVVDTTGAGDAFTAAFLAARAWAWPLPDCAVFANACGAAAATIVGAGERLPDICAIERVLAPSHLDGCWEVARVAVLDHLRSRFARAFAGSSQGA